MIQFVKFDDLGYSNYFRSADVRPEVSDDGQTIIVVNGYGKRRYWGTPSVRSSVRNLTEDVIQIEVTGWHKHTVSPVGGTYYFVWSENEQRWHRRTANHRVVKSVLAMTPDEREAAYA